MEGGSHQYHPRFGWSREGFFLVETSIFSFGGLKIRSMYSYLFSILAAQFGLLLPSQKYGRVAKYNWHSPFLVSRLSSSPFRIRTLSLAPLLEFAVFSFPSSVKLLTSLRFIPTKVAVSKTYKTYSSLLNSNYSLWRMIGSSFLLILENW